MRTALFAACSALALAACAPATETAPPPEAAAPADAPQIAAPAYPDTRTVDQSDVYQSAANGEVTVADPYRWLETDVRVSEEVADWVEAQNAVTNAYLDQLPGREIIAERLAELWNYERYGLPGERGGRYFFTRNDGLQDQSVLYVQDGPDGEPRALIDPNAWAADGTTRWRAIRRARTAARSPTWSPRAARTGAPSACWTWRPAKTCPMKSNG